MNISDQELIEKFLQDVLSPAEQAEFREREESEEFQTLLEKAVVTAFGRSDLKANLKAIANQHRAQQTTQKSPGRTISLRRTLSAAAVFIGLLAIAWFGLRPNHQDASTLYTAYYEAYPDVLNVRGDTPNPISDLAKAMEHYNAQEYDKAVETFAILEQSSTLNTLESFYYGQSLLANDQAEMAIPYFQKSLTTTTSFIEPEARWYIALSYLQMENESEAKAVLKTIAQDPDNTRRASALEILKKLK